MLKQVQAVNEPAPRTWDDYRRGCVSTYRGGYTGKEARAFESGMITVFNLLEGEFPPAEVCRAAPDLLAACEWLRNVMTNDGGDCWCAIRDQPGAKVWVEGLKAAIAKAKA